MSTQRRLEGKNHSHRQFNEATRGYVSRTRQLALALFLVGLVAVVLTEASHAADDASDQSQATVDYPRSSDVTVVSFNQVLGEIGHTDRGPSLRIYGDGRLMVHYPPYMKRAGDYTLQLSQEEMDNLLLSLTSKGIVDFDEQAVGRRKREISMRRAATAAGEGRGPTLFAATDASTTTIELRVDRYRPTGARGEGFLNVKKRISWQGLKSDARQYPDIEEIQNLAAAERELLGLMKRPDLARSE